MVCFRKEGFSASTFFLSTVVIGAVVTPLQARAQDAGNQTGVEEIVVTAQKRSERLVAVPISVSVVDASQLDSAGVRNLSDLSQVVPGFRTDAQGAFLQPTIRGVSSAVAGPGLSAPIATYVDGFYYPSMLGGNFEMADVESVQVLKGPQGTLFGRNATGGAILLTTKEPSFTPEGSARVSHGRYNETRTDLYGTVPLSSTLAASVTAHGVWSDGFADNVVSGEREGDYNSYAVRGKLLYRPTDDTTLTFSYVRNHVDDPNTTLFNAYEGRATAATMPGATVATGRGRISNDYPSENVTNSEGYFLRALHDFGSTTLTSYTAYQHVDQPETSFDLDGSDVPIVAATGYSDDIKTFTQELNLNGKTDRLDWVVGLFYMHDRGTQKPVTLSFGGGPPTPLLRGQMLTKAYAAFADGTLRMTDRFFLTLGARYETDDVSGYYEIAPDYAATRTRASHTFHGFTPRIVGRYEITPDTNVYASFGQGQKSGVFNFGGLSTTPIDPEEIDAYEVGLKTAQGPFQFEAAAFYYDYKDLQVTSYFNAVAVIRNAAKARIYGTEAHVATNLTDNLRLDVGLTYLNAKFVEFPGAPLASFDPVTGVSNAPADASDNRMPRAPKFAGNVNLSYRQDVMGGQMELTGNLSYQSKLYLDNFEEQSVTQDGYEILNLRAAWTTADEKWTFAAYGKNVTDTTYYTQYTPEPPAVLVAYGWPRTYGGEVSFRF